MKCESTDIKQRVIDRKFELVDLWMSCDVPAQFWMQQPMKIPDATATELRAFKIHWFKACHPGLYVFCWIIFTCLCAAVTIFGILLNSFNISICGLLIYFTVSIGHLSLHGDMMEIVEYYTKINGRDMKIESI